MSPASCLYEGTIRHRRFRPVEHAFTYRLFMLYADLDELDSMFGRHPLWSARRPAPLWLRREDHLGDARRNLAEAARDALAERVGERPSGPIRLLTLPRVLGYVFNPVSLYYAYDGEPPTLHSVLAEVTNTPWGDKQLYGVRIPPDAPTTGSWHTLRKQMHVSPFLGMDQSYRWRLREPGEELMVHMENHEEAGPITDATLQLRRRPLDLRSLSMVPLRHPWITIQVIALIHLQALRLWRKRVPFHPHPASAARR